MDVKLSLQEANDQYLQADLLALPASRKEKRPSCGGWKKYQKRKPTETEISAWFANNPDAVCILCGEASNHLEILDFDAQAELYEPWSKRIDEKLLEKLVIQSTQSGGKHAMYRCESAVNGNMKLAQRIHESTGEIQTLIETRGEGGLFLCYPTEGYELVQGELAQLPVLTEEERLQLLDAAWQLNEYRPPVFDGAKHNAQSLQRLEMSAEMSDCPSANSNRPGDDFNHRGNVRSVLEQHGWVRTRGGENEYWRRPGKQSGTSATLKENVFYVFSSNAAPFEPNRGYSPFSVYTLLNHGGDFTQAAKCLGELGYGSNCSDSLSDYSNSADISALVQMSAVPSADNAHISQTIALAGEQDEPKPMIEDPGPVPVEMLRVPGLISEVMDYCLKTAPYPNPVIAFAGALSLQAFLGGRKVRDSGNNRTNLYLLGLAHSASGKDWPRKINNRILMQAGFGNGLGERFASGEGIQDALYQTPSMLFQTDEIDSLLQAINKSQNGQHEAILSTLLTMYSSANSLYPD
ncbi:MAG: bifunctional DNA primase/polymerase [Pseudomonadales bacterium]|nr:bifunctional DNA primase/polymerase [Pseudomonadales bacterium]